jgi:hypothetical protein
MHKVHEDHIKLVVSVFPQFSSAELPAGFQGISGGRGQPTQFQISVLKNNTRAVAIDIDSSQV